MKLIYGLTSSAKQRFKIPVATREKAEMYLFYLPTQLSWYFNFTYNGEEFNGHKLVLGSNILRCYKNIIPFGLAVVSDDELEPYSITDFSSARVKLYVLSKDEVEEVESEIFLL